MPTFSNTQELVSIKEIKEDTVVTKSGRLLKIVMVDGVNFALKSEEEQNIITFAYQNFLNSLDFSIQIVVHSRKINVEKYSAKLEERERDEPSALLQSQIGEYREFVGSFVRQNPIMTKTFLIVVPFAPTTLPTAEIGTLTKFLPFLKKTAPAPEEAEAAKRQNFEENIAQLAQRVDQVAEGLRAAGLDTVVLNTESLIELFYNFYNPETVEKTDIALAKGRNG